MCFVFSTFCCIPNAFFEHKACWRRPRGLSPKAKDQRQAFGLIAMGGMRGLGFLLWSGNVSYTSHNTPSLRQHSKHNVLILDILINLKVSVLGVRVPVGIWQNGKSYRYDRRKLSNILMSKDFRLNDKDSQVILNEKPQEVHACSNYREPVVLSSIMPLALWGVSAW